MAHGIVAQPVLDLVLAMLALVGVAGGVSMVLLLVVAHLSMWEN